MNNARTTSANSPANYAGRRLGSVVGGLLCGDLSESAALEHGTQLSHFCCVGLEVDFFLEREK